LSSLKSLGAPLMKGHLLLKKILPFYSPWGVYWALYFGPWTWLFRALSWLVPKQDNLFIFGSNEGKHYSDNSRSLFEYIQNNDNSIRAVWFTNNRDVYREVEEKYPGKVVMSPSLKASFLYLRAGQAIISFGYQDMCKMPWIPSITVNQLWHGVPLKKIGLLRAKNKTDEDYGETARLFLQWCGNVDRFFVTSRYEKECLSEAFNIPQDRFEITGNPRNDLLYLNKNPLDSDTKTILYTPTFRERGEGEHSRVLLHPDVSEGQMHEFLEKNQAKLIIRPHWITEGRVYKSDRIETVTHFDEPHLHNLFIKSDVLVTDYSSAYIDWLILDRPVVFTPYDLEEYSEKNGLLDDYENLVPPPISTTLEDLFIDLGSALENPQKYSEERNQMKIKYLGPWGYGASERVLSILKSKNF